jgi:DNA sulfur modification protein DndC
MFEDIKQLLSKLYIEDKRPWLVGFSGGKDSTMLASLIFEAIESLPLEQRTKPIAVLCTDTRVEIPAIVEMVENTLKKMQQWADENNLNIEVNLLKPPPEESFWVNIIGRGYPPPNRTFRWCTQRMKIDPVTEFVEKRLGKWGEAILHLGARRAESAARAQSLAGNETKNGLRRHYDMTHVWINNPIEHLTTEEVWAYLLQRNPPWGGSNRELYKLYANASGGECPLVVDESTPSCGHSRFGCWTCTVVDRDKASEGLLASGDDRMQKLIEFRETLIWYRDPANGMRDTVRMNGGDGFGPLTMTARKQLLTKLLELRDETGLEIINQQELYEIQKFWKSARKPDQGNGVAKIVNKQKGLLTMTDPRDYNRLKTIEEEVALEKGISTQTLQRLLAKVEEYSEYERARGLQDDMLNILKDELREREDMGEQKVAS